MKKTIGLGVLLALTTFFASLANATPVSYYYSGPVSGWMEVGLNPASSQGTRAASTSRAACSSIARSADDVPNCVVATGNGKRVVASNPPKIQTAHSTSCTACCADYACLSGSADSSGAACT